jgi:hypothetical protein
MVGLRGWLKRIFVCGTICLVGAVVAAETTSPANPVRNFFVPLDPPGAAYVLDAGISIEAGAAVVRGMGTVTLKNTATRPLSVLAFDWSAGGSRTLEVTADGRSLRLLNAEAGLPNTSPLFFLLPQPVDAGREIRLHLDYSTTAAGSAERISLPRWYPSLWWEGTQVRNSFRVKLAAPAGYALATSGRLNPASGRYENDGVTTQFGLYLAQGLISEARESAGVLITALFTEKGRACAVHCLDAAADIVKFYRERFGFYPHRSLTIIPGQPQPMGGYPLASALVVIHGQETFDPQKGSRPLPWWTWITAHEIGHQYWGECVMAADVRFDYTDAWLMIGLGIVADKEYCLARGLGWERHRAFLERYLQGVRAKNDTTMDAPPSLRKQQKFDTNNIVIHGKGFAVLSALEVLLGHETFGALYGRLLKGSAWRRLGWRDLQHAAEEAVGEKLDGFFEDWVRSNKALVGRITSTTSEPAGENFITEVRVEFEPDSIRMPVAVEAVFEDGRARRLSRTDSPVCRLRFESRAKLKEAASTRTAGSLLSGSAAQGGRRARRRRRGPRLERNGRGGSGHLQESGDGEDHDRRDVFQAGASSLRRRILSGIGRGSPEVRPAGHGKIQPVHRERLVGPFAGPARRAGKGARFLPRSVEERYGPHHAPRPVGPEGRPRLGRGAPENALYLETLSYLRTRRRMMVR